MRVATIVTLSLLLASPLAVGLQIRAPTSVPSVELTDVTAGLQVRAPAAVFEISDADLMLRVARLDHPGLRPLAPPAISASESLPTILARVSVRAQAPLAPDELAAFGALDPQVRAPLVTLFASIESAWDAYDLATRDLSQDEIRELRALRMSDQLATPRGQQLVGQIDQEMLLAAAIMLTDVVESVVVPQLQAAAQNGAWPAQGRMDPVGILRLGTTGNDAESLDRIVQIDPRGDQREGAEAGAARGRLPLPPDGQGEREGAAEVQQVAEREC